MTDFRHRPDYNYFGMTEMRHRKTEPGIFLYVSRGFSVKVVLVMSNIDKIIKIVCFSF